MLRRTPRVEIELANMFRGQLQELRTELGDMFSRTPRVEIELANMFRGIPGVEN